MCLGAQARAANENARRNYQYQLQRREQEWMQTLSMTGVERIQYEQGLNAADLGLANVYADIQEKHGDLVDQAMAQDQDDWKQFLQNNTGAKLAASGVTGKSAQRIASLDLAGYLKAGSDRANQLTKSAKQLNKEGAMAAAKTKHQKMNMFAQQAMVKMPDIAPPQPVMQNVGMAAFSEALSMGMSVAGPFIAAGSDRKLKENIKKIGESISGLGIYTFNYIGKAKRYIGTMSDDVKKLFPEAVVIMDNGYEGVRYDLIDVQFKEIV